MSHVALTTAFTGATWNVATQSIVFNNNLNSNISQVVLSAEYAQTSNHFCDMLCYDPVSKRILRLDFRASDLLLYEWHARIHDSGSRIEVYYGIPTRPTLNDFNRENYINLRRNVRQTVEYSMHEAWHPRFRGNGGTYGPHTLVTTWHRSLILAFPTGDGAYHLNGYKSISAISYVWCIGPGDYGLGDVYMLILYYGMSWGSICGSYETGDYAPHNNNSWPYSTDTRTDASDTGRIFKSTYLVAT